MRGTEARVTTAPLTETSPVWSPGGDQIIFRANNAGANQEFFRMPPRSGANVDGVWNREQQFSKPTAPRSAMSCHRDWSRDGRYVVYHVTDEDSGVQRLGVANGGRPHSHRGWQQDEPLEQISGHVLLGR